jgi:hypothetical protein
MADVPAAAHALGAFRQCEHGQSVLYAAVTEAHGQAFVAAVLQAGARAGAVCALLDPGHPKCLAVLDLLDESGDVIGDRCIPTDEAFAWWRRAVELRATSSDCEVCEPAAFAAARTGGGRG